MFHFALRAQQIFMATLHSDIHADSMSFCFVKCNRWVCCGWHAPPAAQSNQFQLSHDSGR